MSKKTTDVEEIRIRIMSLLAGSLSARHKMAALSAAASPDQQGKLADLGAEIAEIDMAARELYHLLPEEMRPIGIPRPAAPRLHNPESHKAAKPQRPTPGGSIPREIRWPSWTVDAVLSLADRYHEVHGKWPNTESGRVEEGSPDTWNGIDKDLRNGLRDLPGGTTLGKLIAKHRGVRNKTSIPDLDIELILRWVDAHKARTGEWPSVASGAVTGVAGESWLALNHALSRGSRALEGGTSLATLLEERRGVSHYHHRDLSVEQILAWVDAHFERTGRWPSRYTGAIEGADGETWLRVDSALRLGLRSMPRGSSLASFLVENRGHTHRNHKPEHTLDRIEAWARSYHDRTGAWPTPYRGGTIPEAPGENWRAVHAAFATGCRGLAGCGYPSLAAFLNARIGKLKRHGASPAERIQVGEADSDRT